MLSCDAVQERLFALATGEPATPEEREHLAQCDACREARRARARHVDRVREGLTSLAPSPLLEDAVLESAAQTEEGRPRRPWPYVAAAGLAAAALFLVVILPRLDPGDPVTDDGRVGGEEPLGRARVSIPPSAQEVLDARRRNEDARPRAQAADRGPGPRFRHASVSTSGEHHVVEATGFLPVDEDVVHRYVYEDEWGKPGEHVQSVASFPSMPGVLLLGKGLLNAIGGKLTAGEITAIQLGEKRWQATVGTPEGEITLGSPDAAGAEARVRVLVSTGYSGTLMIEGPLARALGLHLFEIPGGVRFQDPNGGTLPMRGDRARARVTIPELGFEAIIEVQVVHARPWQRKQATAGAEREVRFPGITPAGVLQARRMEHDAQGNEAWFDVVRTWSNEEGAVHAIDPGDGAWRLLLSFGSAEGEVPLLPDVPILGELFRNENANLVPRALDLAPGMSYDLDVSRMKLGGTWPAGADVVIARVWRGTTAIPSSEAVAWTRVKSDGSLSFLRLPGEPGATLRMLVTGKDGTSTFHQVVVAPELLPVPRLRVRVGANGRVRVGGGTAANLLSSAWLGDENAGASREGFAALREILRQRADVPGVRDEQGIARLEIGLNVERDTPWRFVQWVLQALADPEVKITRFRLGPEDAPERAIAQALPVDGGLAAAGLGRADPMLRVSLRRRQAGEPLRLYVGEGAGVETSPAALPEVVTRRREDRPLSASLAVPPPGFVTFEEVFDVVEALRRAGVEELLYEGAPRR